MSMDIEYNEIGINRNIRGTVFFLLRDLFPTEPIPPLPIYPETGVDQTEVERIQVVFGGRPWTVIQLEDMIGEFGYDLSYVGYLDLPCRAYYMPALIWHAMTNLDVLER